MKSLQNLLALVFVLSVTFPVLAAAPSPQGEAAAYVGRAACAGCHQAETERWQGSHHDLAMQEATEGTVLGDFNNAQFTRFGVTSTFFRQDGRFMVRTDGPDGALHDYAIRYVFGVFPLQQYLIEFPGGRLQTLGIAWDSRPRADGGQRWFHLYPDQQLTPANPLHWTGPDQTWNYMCAECHSTNLKKNYDPQADRYATAWSELNVSCEACHGPGSRHVAWAKAREGGATDGADPDKGLVVRFTERAGVEWPISPDTGNARRRKPRETRVEIDLCARCHARRGLIAEDYTPGRSLLDTHLPQLLTAGMYYPDGQMEDEVYNYGSFLQSRMYQKGVTCSDCHDPHSLKLRAPGNGVCAQCHQVERYDTAAHHFHPPGTTGAGCAACHAPATTYMVVDPRHDHSFRIPRPDLSVKLGTPNACNQCHQDRTPEWAAAKVKEWYGRQPAGYQTFAEALQAARTGAPDAERRLAQLAAGQDQPAIVRATALAELHRYLSPKSLAVVQQGLQDADPLVRLGALSALEAAPPEHRPALALPLLQDPVRAVRTQAARWLAGAPADQLTPEQQVLREKMLAEYIATQQVNADRPEAHLNLGLLYLDQGQPGAAEAAYQTALKRQPTFTPAAVNLADLYRLQGRDDEGEQVLREALRREPGSADLHHALGLLLVRRQHSDEAVAALGQAAERQPGNARYSYVYAIALHSAGKPAQAIPVLEQAHARHPNDRDIVQALVTFHREQGNRFAARLFAEKLVKLTPDDPGARQLLEQLRQPQQ